MPSRPRTVHRDAKPPKQAGAALRGPLAGGGRSAAGGRVPLPPAAQMAGRLRPRPEPHAHRDRGRDLRAGPPQPHRRLRRRHRKVPGGRARRVAGGAPRPGRTHPSGGGTPGGPGRRGRATCGLTHFGAAALQALHLAGPHAGRFRAGCGQRRSLVRQRIQAGCSRKDCGQGPWKKV